MAGSRGEWGEVSSRDATGFLNLLLMTPSAPGLLLVRGRQQVHFVRASGGFHLLLGNGDKGDSQDLEGA